MPTALKAMIGESKAESLLTIIIFLALSPGSHPEVELARADRCPLQIVCAALCMQRQCLSGVSCLNALTPILWLSI